MLNKQLSPVTDLSGALIDFPARNKFKLNPNPRVLSIEERKMGNQVKVVGLAAEQGDKSCAIATSFHVSVELQIASRL